jgi:hypothetical protein
VREEEYQAASKPGWPRHIRSYLMGALNEQNVEDFGDSKGAVRDAHPAGHHSLVHGMPLQWCI